MPHPRPNRIDPIHTRIRTQTPHPLLCSAPNSRDDEGRRVLRRRVVADRTLSQKDVSLQCLRACEIPAPAPPGVVVLVTPLLAQTGQAASPKVETRVRAPNPRNAREPLVWETSAVATTARRHKGDDDEGRITCAMFLRFTFRSHSTLASRFLWRRRGRRDVYSFTNYISF